MDDLTQYDGQADGDDKSHDKTIQRPAGTYDNVILFIERFPLRLVIVLAGFGLLWQLALYRDTLTSDALMSATLGYIVGFFVVVAEAVTGFLTNLIKGLLLGIVMRAEENSKVL